MIPIPIVIAAHAPVFEATITVKIERAGVEHIDLIAFGEVRDGQVDLAVRVNGIDKVGAALLVVKDDDIGSWVLRSQFSNHSLRELDLSILRLLNIFNGLSDCITISSRKCMSRRQPSHTYVECKANPCHDSIRPPSSVDNSRGLECINIRMLSCWRTEDTSNRRSEREQHVLGYTHSVLCQGLGCWSKSEYE